MTTNHRLRRWTAWLLCKKFRFHQLLVLLSLVSSILLSSLAQAGINNNHVVILNNNNNLGERLLLEEADPFAAPSFWKYNKRHWRHLLSSNKSNSTALIPFEFVVATTTTTTTTRTPSPPPILLATNHDVYLLYRGGDKYRDPVDTTTTTTTATKVVTANGAEHPATIIAETDKQQHRLDTEAKSKSYGQYEFPLFQNEDGSDQDPEGIPLRYLRMQLHNRERAKKALIDTLEWRKKHDIDTILARPHPDYDVCKAVFPHYFVGERDVDGHVIFVQRPALLDFDLAAKNNLHNQELLTHYVYVNEYLWQIMEADNALATMTSILDLQGLRFGLLKRGDLVNFLKEFVKTMDAHFPQRSNKMIVVNAPKWFNVLYKIISPLLRESTKAKIEIHSNGKKQDKVLRSKFKNPADAERLLPETFFSSYKKNHPTKKQNGSSKNNNNSNNNNNNNDEEEEEDEDLPPPADHHEISPLEKELRDFTLARLKEAGVQMQPVIP